MKIGYLVAVFLALAAPLSHADIYKWKDKNGVIRYSDVPPPSNVPHEAIGKRSNKSTAVVEQPGADTPEAPVTPSGAATPAPSAPSDGDPNAAKRQKEAEEAKKKAESAEAEQQRKQENCTQAKSKLHTYQQGGRISKMNEQGEREFIDDAALAKGLEEAQAEVDKYCQ
jgi:hypothetical protein